MSKLSSSGHTKGIPNNIELTAEALPFWQAIQARFQAPLCLNDSALWSVPSLHGVQQGQVIFNLRPRWIHITDKVLALPGTGIMAIMDSLGYVTSLLKDAEGLKIKAVGVFETPLAQGRLDVSEQLQLECLIADFWSHRPYAYGQPSSEFLKRWKIISIGETEAFTRFITGTNLPVTVAAGREIVAQCFPLWIQQQQQQQEKPPQGHDVPSRIKDILEAVMIEQRAVVLPKASSPIGLTPDQRNVKRLLTYCEKLVALALRELRNLGVPVCSTDLEPKSLITLRAAYQAKEQRSKERDQQQSLDSQPTAESTQAAQTMGSSAFTPESNLALRLDTQPPSALLFSPTARRVLPSNEQRRGSKMEPDTRTPIQLLVAAGRLKIVKLAASSLDVQTLAATLDAIELVDAMRTPKLGSQLLEAVSFALRQAVEGTPHVAHREEISRAAAQAAQLLVDRGLNLLDELQASGQLTDNPFWRLLTLSQHDTAGHFSDLLAQVLVRNLREAGFELTDAQRLLDEALDPVAIRTAFPHSESIVSGRLPQSLQAHLQRLILVTELNVFHPSIDHLPSPSPRPSTHKARRV